MDLSQLKSFMAVAEFGNLTRAAQEQFLDVSAVSRRISQLERELGVQLFYRGPTMELTPKGRILLNAAATSVADLEAAAASVRATGDLPVVRVFFPGMLNRSVRDLLLHASDRSAIPVALDLIPSRNNLIAQRLQSGGGGFSILHVGRNVSSGRGLPGLDRLIVETINMGAAINARSIDTTRIPRLADLRHLRYITSENETAPQLYGQLDAALNAAGVHARLELPRHDPKAVAAIVGTQPAFAFIGLQAGRELHGPYADDPEIWVTGLRDFSAFVDTKLYWTPSLLDDPERALLDAVGELLGDSTVASAFADQA